MKRENIRDELLVCLKEYHNLADAEHGEIHHELCIGKWSSRTQGRVYNFNSLRLLAAAYIF